MKPKHLTIHNIQNLQNKWITKWHYIKEIQTTQQRYYIRVSDTNNITGIEIGRLLIDEGRFTLHTDNGPFILPLSHILTSDGFIKLLSGLYTETK